MFLNSPRRLLNQQQVKNQFDRAAATYDSAAGLQRKMGESLQDELRTLGLPKDIKLIDLGCGTGELLRQLEQDGYTSLYGLDLSSSMIEVAKTKAPSVDFLHAPIESVPVGDSKFDVVISNAAIQWCDTETAACEIARILKPGGHLLLNSFVHGTLRQWDEAFVACGVASRVHPLATSKETESAFASAGFQITAIAERVATSSFDSVTPMFSSIRKLGATNATTSRKQSITRSEYLAIREHFQEQVGVAERVDLDFVWVQLCAQKWLSDQH